MVVAYSSRELASGAILLAPDQMTVVSTPFGQVRVADRAVALVVSNNTGLSVYNLDDSKRDSVSLAINGECISLPPGAHVTITHDSNQRFEDVNPAQYIAYRNVRSRKMNGDFKAFHSEFNHMSAIAGLEPLKNMMSSNDSAKKKMAQHILKTSALVALLSKSTTPYEYMAPPAMTAMK